jgi:predicted GIY-YIG superfamily endonuclease
MSFWVYLLRCADGRYYTGHTDELDRRMAEHAHGGFSRFTSQRRPVTLVWKEELPTRIEALEAERRIGGWSRAKKEALIKGDWPLLSALARPPHERFSTSLETNGDGEGSPAEGPYERPSIPRPTNEDGAHA